MREDLFTVNGQAVRFFVLPIPEKDMLTKLIESGGGAVLEDEENDTVAIGTAQAAHEIGFDKEVYTANLVFDSVKNNALPSDEGVYLIQTSTPQKPKNKITTYKSPVTSGKKNRKRRPYSEEEDKRILELVEGYDSEVITGSRLFRLVASELGTGRTWDSIRSHFRNAIMPKLSHKKLAALKNRTPSHKRTRWPEESAQPSKSRKTKEASDHSEGERSVHESESEIEQRLEEENIREIDQCLEEENIRDVEQRMEDLVNRDTPEQTQTHTHHKAAPEPTTYAAPAMSMTPQAADNVITMLCALTSRTEDVVLYALVSLNGNIFDALLYLMDPEGYVQRAPKDRLPWTKEDDQMIDQEDENASVQEQINRRGKAAVQKRLAFLTDES
eukprot:TRINITY_DN18268_c0_g1_i1.p1 TRINITY_DN18268_c0_g1~~TRINITY_DN18268_c0_g1_i1.p1  ORF type:complete len:418 (+),score=97.06 TRINITY_DN18268_c0_g1_i1:98-1255(+)